MVIQIDKKGIFERIELITSRTALSVGRLDEVSATDDEKEIILSYWRDSLVELCNSVKRYASFSESDAGAVFVFEMPSNWKVEFEPALIELMRQYCVNHICMKWFNISNKDEVEYYAGICNGLEDKIKRLLSERKKPVRALGRL